MRTLLDHIIFYMKDGQPHRLSEIVNAVHEMGWRSSPSSRYIASYHELREHPSMFERVGHGAYRLVKIDKSAIPDMEDVREAIYSLMKKRGSMTPSQIWKALVSQGIIITYKQTFQALKGGFFEKKNQREYVATKRVKYNAA